MLLTKKWFDEEINEKMKNSWRKMENVSWTLAQMRPLPELHICSFKRYVLNTYYAPVIVLTEGDKISLSSWNLHSSGRREQANIIYACQIMKRAMEEKRDRECQGLEAITMINY